MMNDEWDNALRTNEKKQGEASSLWVAAASLRSSFIIHHSSFRALRLIGPLAFILGMTFFFASPVSSQPSADMSPAQRDYCRVVQACGLTARPGACPAGAVQVDPKRFDPDGSRCAEARELAARGIGPDHRTLGFRLYRFLGHEFRITYAIPAQKLKELLNRSR
jgi:hypothetical protein